MAFDMTTDVKFLAMKVLQRHTATLSPVSTSGVDSIPAKPLETAPERSLRFTVKAVHADPLPVIAESALALPTFEPAQCRHCDRAGECDCPACTLRRTEKAVPCLMCRSQERQVWLAATRREACWHCGGSGTCGCIGCERAGVCTVCGGSAKERVQ